MSSSYCTCHRSLIYSRNSTFTLNLLGHLHIAHSGRPVPHYHHHTPTSSTSKAAGLEAGHPNFLGTLLT
ncbi:hypothetical protein P8C59_006943 [Phyllachora maydis]|uniref:Uncharacterized protein n=1 Tax=Phyllachora maydis TaxID=1825666 RepID=A0AAD9MD14_9PEZI|nr:hypothetical protein P8C59_006943 [Phyllachora maydis]